VRQAWQLMHNSFEASFASAEAKAGWMAALDRVFAEAA